MSDPTSDATAKAKEIAEAIEKGAVEIGKDARVALEAIEEEAERGASRVARTARGALTTIERGVATPDGADLAPLLSATDLPELPPDGALGSLGVRLDREADLYRNVALRELGRVAWIDRLTLIAVLVAFAGELGVAAGAAFSALMGAHDGRGGMFALAALILAIAPAGVAAIVASSRRMHRELADGALKRSRDIEESIFALAVVMEWRGTEAPLFQDALARLERRVAPPLSET